MMEKDHRLDDYFVQYKDMVIRNIYLYVDYYTAEDLCQETFIRLSEDLERVEPEKMKAWLLEVSDNLTKDYLKKGGKYKVYLGLGVGTGEIVDFRSDTELIAAEREESRLRCRVLKRLRQEKQDWYDSLIWHCVGHMSDKEISKRKGVKASLIGKWRQRAKEKLREWYEEEDKGKDD